jgi:hypothetical protein
MRIASDGLPYDVDYLGDAQPGEVEIIQWLRPDGRRRRMTAQVGVELASAAHGLVLSAEELGTGHIMLYARRKGDGPKNEISAVAQNGPGPDSPLNVLKRLITMLLPDAPEDKQKEES